MSGDTSERCENCQHWFPPVKLDETGWCQGCRDEADRYLRVVERRLDEADTEPAGAQPRNDKGGITEQA